MTSESRRLRQRHVLGRTRILAAVKSLHPLVLRQTKSVVLDLHLPRNSGLTCGRQSHGQEERRSAHGHHPYNGRLIISDVRARREKWASKLPKTRREMSEVTVRVGGALWGWPDSNDPAATNSRSRGDAAPDDAALRLCT
jgi:hypothetical protein